jgi:phosphatidylserine/phosphatidylglycerophosphate/cardiolipin synthase-like enzyme
MQLNDWFLTGDERGNSATSIDDRHDGSWSENNSCRVLVHGATYFARLHEELVALEDGDRVFFTDWRGDPDERLVGAGTEIGSVLCELARRGVAVRGLLWRSHPDQMRFSEQENTRLVDQINEAGGQAFLDERVRRGGSHHQKLFVIRHQDRPEDDIAFVGGIDVSHGRHDDERHLGDPQAIAIDRRYGQQPAWHDLQVEVRGPAVGDLEHTFRERWNDPASLRRGPWGRALAKAAVEPAKPEQLAPQGADPASAGSHAVQVLRTYPAKRPAYPFAPCGERSIALAYLKAFGRARSLIYVEDQYLWSAHAADALAEALTRNPELRVVVVVPAYPDQDGRFSGAANRVSQLRVLSKLHQAGGARFAAYNLEGEDGCPIYVHSKLCVIDDVWMMAGSDNFNRRSWTHDSELSLSILDATPDDRAPTDPGGRGDRARVLPRAARLQLWGEHLEHEDVPVEPITGFDMLAASASALDAWHDGGRRAARPPGRLRNHRPQAVHWWARPMAQAFYRAVCDPDGRPLALRFRNRY